MNVCSLVGHNVLDILSRDVNLMGCRLVTGPRDRNIVLKVGWIEYGWNRFDSDKALTSVTQSLSWFGGCFAQ